jgi:tripartite-type tricarboxylate transporter receptor subunit TctC
MNYIDRRQLATLVLAAMGLLSWGATAQTAYPTQTLKIIVPFTPGTGMEGMLGGGMDPRAMQQMDPRMMQQLQQQMQMQMQQQPAGKGAAGAPPASAPKGH